MGSRVNALYSFMRQYLVLCFKTRTSLGAHHENLNEDRPILSATTVYPDIRGGSRL